MQFGEIECARLGVKPQNRNQQGCRGNEREEEELERSFRSLLTAVHGNQDRHGNQRQFPEAVIDHHVERDEDAQHRRLLNKEEYIEDLAASLDRIPAGNDAGWCEQGNEDDKPKTQPINTNVVRDRRVLDPRPVDLKLKASLSAQEMCGQMQRKHERDQRGQKRNPR